MQLLRGFPAPLSLQHADPQLHDSPSHCDSVASTWVWTTLPPEDAVAVPKQAAVRLNPSPDQQSVWHCDRWLWPLLGAQELHLRPCSVRCRSSLALDEASPRVPYQLAIPMRGGGLATLTTEQVHSCEEAMAEGVEFLL